MQTTAIDRLNELTEERGSLFREASNGRGTPETRERIKAISAELETLWAARRQERAGKPDGIDLLVERAYRQVYGARYEDVIAPPAVEEESADPVRAAA